MLRCVPSYCLNTDNQSPDSYRGWFEPKKRSENPQLDTGDFFMGHTVYILHSISLNRFYIGATKNITQRLSFHRLGFPHKFTAKAKDWTVFLIVLMHGNTAVFSSGIVDYTSYNWWCMYFRFLLPKLK